MARKYGLRFGFPPPLSSVYFDDHFSLQAHEVHNIRSDRMLA